MHYVIQENFFKERNLRLLLETLGHLDLPFETIPLAADEDMKAETTRQDVMCFGAARMARFADKQGWRPGSFYNANHDFLVHGERYGERMLNADAHLMRFDGPVPDRFPEQVFIRPTHDSKIFSGSPFLKSDWNDFVKTHRDPEHAVSPARDTWVMVSMIKRIHREIRCWIVKGKVVTASYYKVDGKGMTAETNEPEITAFAEEAAAAYRPADAFVMDVCGTDRGLKIVEINCLNCSGFYDGDIEKLIISLERHFGTR